MIMLALWLIAGSIVGIGMNISAIAQDLHKIAEAQHG
jgi:hypothetical protein